MVVGKCVIHYQSVGYQKNGAYICEIFLYAIELIKTLTWFLKIYMNL